MSELAMEYSRQVHRAYELFYANWFPDAPVKLGDIGILHRKTMFERKSNLGNELKVDFSLRPATITLPVKGEDSNNYQFTTGQGSQCNIIGKGDANMINGGVEIILAGENSFFFNLAGVVIQEIEDQIKLSKQIIDLYARDLWNKDWCVITSILYSSSSTILGSRSGNKKVVLEAQSNIPDVRLSDASLNLTLKSSSQLDYHLISKGGLTPLFKISKLRSSVFHETSFAMNEEETDLDELKQKVIGRSLDLSEYITLAPLVGD